MFGEHLQHLFDVIASLDPKDPLDLTRFQLFMHFRAFRKLGWRVQAFLTHWGVLPFDILSKHLDPVLPSKTFDFPFISPHFHTCLQHYLKAGAEMYSHVKGKYVYLVDADNALQWLCSLKAVWSGLQDSLLIKDNSNWWVRADSPEPRTVNSIVSRIFFLEALMPIFEHLLSAEGAAAALQNAGECGFPNVDCSTYVFQLANVIVNIIGALIATLMPKSGLLTTRNVYRLFFLELIYKMSCPNITLVSIAPYKHIYLTSVVQIVNPTKNQSKTSSGLSKWFHHGKPPAGSFSNKLHCFNPSLDGHWSNSAFLTRCWHHFHSTFPLYHNC